MPIAQIGPWEFLVPDNWNLKRYDNGVSYFEAPDGAHGMYVKSIDLKAPENSAYDVAAYIQDIQQRNFENRKDSNWSVVDRRGRSDGPLYRSALDIYDPIATYRILSLVVSDEQQAIQVTLHDYLCESYASEKDSHTDVEDSIVRRIDASAA